MRYSRKVASSFEQLGAVSTCLCPKYIKFDSQNLGDGREDKNRRRQTTLGFNNENKISDTICLN